MFTSLTSTPSFDLSSRIGLVSPVAATVTEPKKPALVRTTLTFCAAAMVLVGISHSAHAWTNPWPQGRSRTGQAALKAKNSQPQRKPVRFRAILKPDSGPPVELAVHEIIGPEFHVTIYRPGQAPKPSVLRADELIGMYWQDRHCVDGLCVKAWFRIVDSMPDQQQNSMRAHSDNSDVWLHRVEYIESKSGAHDWNPVCDPGPDGRAAATFVSGTWDSAGTFSQSDYTLACTNGVINKCLRMLGYKPWKQLTTSNGDEIDLGPLHRACVRAGTADYCGDGSSYTRDGTIIHVSDRHGLNPSANLAGYTKEAGFSEHGAVWMARPRLSVRGQSASEVPCRAHLPASPTSQLTALLVVSSRPQQ